MIGLGFGYSYASRKSRGVVAPGPVNTVAPVVTNAGTGDIGDTLSCTTGTWTTLGTISGYSYDWLRDGVSIGAADQDTYDLDAADDDALISCRVTATDEFNSRSRTSNAVGPFDLVPEPGLGFTYLRPGGVDSYLRPGGVDTYLRP